MTIDLSAGQTQLSLSNAARQLAVSPPTLRRWADQGAIRHMVTPGDHRRFAASEIKRFWAGRRRRGSAGSLENKWAEVALQHARAEIGDHVPYLPAAIRFAFDGNIRVLFFLTGDSQAG